LNNKVLILGGYGTFGARIAATLSKDSVIEVLVSGRNLAAARMHCHQHGCTPLSLDRDAPEFAAHLAKLRPFVVIDAAGPFQNYGASRYRVALAALAAGAHYLDLSDDAAFTVGIRALDATALTRGLTVLSGVSSVPALSSAAVEFLLPGLTDVHLISTAILPGNRAPRGLSVIRAILAQVGKPLDLRRGGRRETVRGWSGLTCIKLPGLSARWASLIGAPDLSLFPDAYNARSVIFRAGLELPVMHFALTLLAVAVRLRILSGLDPLARPLRWIAAMLHRFGSDRGGMQVRVAGLCADGTAEERTWTLIAEAGHGPQIPAVPAIVLTRALFAGTLKPGARPCLGAFTLAEAEAALKTLSVSTHTETQRLPLLFGVIRGLDYAALPAPVRDLHTVIDRRHWSGQASVTRGKALLARLAAALMRFPPAASDVAVAVVMTRNGPGEIWVRNFGGRSFHSHLSADRHGCMTERFGRMRFRIGLNLRDGRLHYPVVGGSFLGLPLPRALLPRSTSHEAVDGQGRATFDVALSHPLTGLIVRYQGWLQPAP
jgi:Domain of unknown function (DUF4166)/Saccharopine dehydrogenase NADP binding domain